MLEKPHNIVAGRDMFEKKLSLYEKSGNYLARSIAHVTQVGDSTTVTAIDKDFSMSTSRGPLRTWKSDRRR